MDEILKMIEAVDPADTDKLDEIDCLVHEFFVGGKPIAALRIHERITTTDMGHGSAFLKKGQRYCERRYTRSRDELKAIRPKGWRLTLLPCDLRYIALLRDGPGAYWMSGVDSERLPTEELAELHAIIQAIAFERTKQ